MKKTSKIRGQSLVEYVALTALVAIVSIGTVKVFGGKVRTRLNQITNTFDKNVQQGLRRSPALDDTDDDVGSFPRQPQLPDIFKKLPRVLPF